MRPADRPTGIVAAKYDAQGGGGGTQVQRGAAPALRISQKKGSFFEDLHMSAIL